MDEKRYKLNKKIKIENKNKIMKENDLNKKNEDEDEIKKEKYNIQNNKILFSLNKFRKIKKNHYNAKEECEKEKYVWHLTNPRFEKEKFNHLYFHAGDYQDISKYALLPLRYFYSFETFRKYNNLKNEKIKLNDNRNERVGKRERREDREREEKLFKLYKNIDYTSIINTFYYMFNKFKKGIFVIIHNNKLIIYLFFNNYNYENYWYKQTYFLE